MDFQFPENFSQIQYLSTSPVVTTFHGVGYFVPKIETPKILSSLIMKGGLGDHTVNLQRLLSARVYLFFTDARDVVQGTLLDYIMMYRNELDAAGVPVNKFVWSDDVVYRFYLGHPEGCEESSVFSQLTDEMVPLDELLACVD